MQWGRLHISKKWLILGLVGLLFPLFQNMSPVGENSNTFDIRDMAPRKPAGTWENPDAAYFPQGFSGGSLSAVGQGLLDHNFKDQAKLLEVSLLGSDKRSFGGVQDATETGSEAAEIKGRWDLGLISANKLRFTYESPQNLKFTCEAESGQSGLKLKMSQPLSSRWNFDFVHETAQRQSQVQLDYRW